MKSILTRESDQFPTDDWLKAVFSDWFDPCPLNPNPTIDGLSVPWRAKKYVNPPYSNVLPWVQKGIREYQENGYLECYWNFNLIPPSDTFWSDEQ